MSGIVNQAGSKSGVIGQTELDYEEGTWTPAPSAGAWGLLTNNFYTKIGGLCFIQARCMNITDAGISTISALPFATNPAGSAYEATAGNAMFQGVGFLTDTGNITSYIYNNKVYFYLSSSGSGWTHLSGASYWAVGDDVIFHCTYRCSNVAP